MDARRAWCSRRDRRCDHRRCGGRRPGRRPKSYAGRKRDTTAGQTDVTTEPTVDSPTPTTPTAEPSATNAPAYEQLTIYYVGPTPSNPRLMPRLYPELHTSLVEWRLARGCGRPRVLHLGTARPRLQHPVGQQESRSRASPSSETATRQSAWTATPTSSAHPRRASTWTTNSWAVQALLATAGVEGPVDFTYNGADIDARARVATPVALQPELVRAMVSITSPVEGETVDSPVTVKGSANVFEGNLNWSCSTRTARSSTAGTRWPGPMSGPRSRSNWDGSTRARTPSARSSPAPRTAARRSSTTRPSPSADPPVNRPTGSRWSPSTDRNPDRSPGPTVLFAPQHRLRSGFRRSPAVGAAEQHACGHCSSCRGAQHRRPEPHGLSANRRELGQLVVRHATFGADDQDHVTRCRHLNA